MSALWTVTRKELLESLRDRRTLLSALLFAPLFGPLLFAAMMSIMLTKSVADSDQNLELTIGGQQYAPNLIAFLDENGARVGAGPTDDAGARRAIRERQASLVVIIPKDYGAQFRSGRPTTISLYADTSDPDTARHVSRAQQLFNAYASRLASQRLAARGLSTDVVEPLVIDQIDVSTPAARSLLVLGMMSYFLLFATLVGGLYLTIDATAGERERGSLEALLTLPVERTTIIYGKILAACAFMAGSLVVALCAFLVSLRFVHFEELGMSANFGPLVAARMFLVVLPFVPLGAALMTVVASFTRSYREAQSWLTAVLLIPTIPIMIAAVNGLKATPALLAIPSLGQHLLITGLLRDEGLPWRNYAIVTASTLVVALVLTWLAGRLYRREALLG